MREKASFPYILYSFFYMVYVFLIPINSVVRRHIDLLQQRTFDVTAGILCRVIFCILYVFLLLAMTHISRSFQKAGIWLHLAGSGIAIGLALWGVYHIGNLNTPVLMLGAASVFNLGYLLYKKRLFPMELHANEKNAR